MPLFNYQPTAMYDSPRYTATVIDLLRQGTGQGQIWGQAIQNIGGMAAALVQQHQAQKEQQKRAALFGQALQSWDTNDPDASIARLAQVVGPGDALKFGTGMMSLQAAIQKNKEGQIPTAQETKDAIIAAHILKKNAPEMFNQTYPGLRAQYGLAAEKHFGIRLPETATPEVSQGLDALAEQWSPEKKTPVSFEHIQTDKGIQPFNKATGELGPVLAAAPEKPKNLQHVETAKGIQTYDPTTGQLGPVIAQGKPPASLVVNPQKEEDSDTNAQSMVDGRALPTTFSKRGSDFNHLIALADKKSMQQTGKHFSPVKLQLDYDAAKRFVSNMNGPQMIRFKALAGSVVNTMEEVKSLAEELKQGGVQKWNQAKRDTILQVYGNTPQSALAARYVSAVNTLKEEFANLAQGGYAPTEDAWKLADQQINGNFGLKDMGASLTEAQRLINYRLGAFQDLSPTFAGGGTGSVDTGAAPAAASKKNPFR